MLNFTLRRTVRYRASNFSCRIVDFCERPNLKFDAATKPNPAADFAQTCYKYLSFHWLSCSIVFITRKEIEKKTANDFPVSVKNLAF